MLHFQSHLFTAYDVFIYFFFHAHITSIILCIGIMNTWSLPMCKRLPILVSQPKFPGTFMTENLIKKIPLMCVVYVSTAGKTHVLGNIFKLGWWRVGGVVPLPMLWSFCPLETCWKVIQHFIPVLQRVAQQAVSSASLLPAFLCG